MKKIIISIIMMLISISSFAIEVKYIGINNANIREYANYDSPIIDKLPKGKLVNVYETLNNWSRLTDVREINQRWVHSDDLCNTKGCSVRNTAIISNVKPKSKTKQLNSTTNYKPKKTTQVKVKKAKQRSIYPSSCSCGYGYCYGPRGGRYCITSGGNKSYR